MSLLRGARQPAIAATTLATPPARQKDAPQIDVSWFMDTDVFETTEDYNSATNRRCFEYVNGDEGRRADLFQQVHDAVEAASNRVFAKLSGRERMGIVRVTIEAALRPAKWQINAELGEGVGNPATDPATPGWEQRTHFLLASAFMLSYQAERRAPRAVAA
jgi:hypothetical protein